MTGISNGGAFATALEELRQCGFIRTYRAFPGKKTGELYQLIDPCSLFRLRFVEGCDDERWWIADRDGGTVRAWSGRVFELLCLWHVPQILRALGVSGISVRPFSWRSDTSGPGAQIDLVLDRRDDVINLCEMKWMSSDEPVRIDEDCHRTLVAKRGAFTDETRIPNALHLTMVTPNGVAHNAYFNDISAQVTIDDLFVG